MPVGGVDARSLAGLRGAALAMKAVPREIRNAINRQTRSTLNQIWRDEVSQKVSSMPRVDQIVLGKGARVRPGNPSTALAATSRRPLSGGLIPNKRAKGFEFGTDDRDRTTTYRRRSRTGGMDHMVTRRTTRHLPRRSPNGRAIWPAWAETAPRMISLQVQTIVRIINEALEQ